MAKQSEIIPIFSAGISYKRFLVPYIIAGSFLASLLFIGNHYVIPYSNKKKNDFEIEVFKLRNRQTTVGSSSKDRSNIHFFISPNEKIYANQYRSLDSSIQKFRLEEFNDEGQIVKILKAHFMKFNSDSSTWTMKDYEIRTIDGMNEKLLKFKDEKKDTVINMHPEDFIRYTKQREMLSTPDLKKFIAQEQIKGVDAAQSYLVELHRRTAHPFTLLILTILGASIASRKVRGGMGYHIAMGVVLGALLEILSKFSMTFSSNLGMSPFLGVWFPNIVFMFITAYLILKAQK
jgi:lipopolysaccharide export system permease protein